MGIMLRRRGMSTDYSAPFGPWIWEYVFAPQGFEAILPASSEDWSWSEALADDTDPGWLVRLRFLLYQC